MVATRGCQFLLGWLLAVHCGGWHCWQLPLRHGTASEDGACSNDILRRLCLQRTAAGCTASLGYIPVWYIIGRRRKRLPWLAGMATEAFLMETWLFDGDSKKWGNTAHLSDGDLANRSVMWSAMADVARSPRVVFEVSRARWSLAAGEVAPRSGSSSFTLSKGVWCCSGTTAKGPAWRWFFWCGVVSLSLSGPCRCRVTAGGFGDCLKVDRILVDVVCNFCSGFSFAAFPS